MFVELVFCLEEESICKSPEYILQNFGKLFTTKRAEQCGSLEASFLYRVVGVDTELPALCSLFGLGLYIGIVLHP